MAIDWKATVAAVAPTLATALGGPLAGTAISILSQRVLGTGDITDADLGTVISGADPEVLARIKEAEIQFQQTLASLDVDLERIAADDRDSARRREIETGDHVPAVIGSLVLLGFFVAFAALLFFPLPDGSKEALYILLGALGGMATSVVSYFFGSSAGSAQKNKLLSAKQP